MKIDCPSCKGKGSFNLDVNGIVKKKCPVCDGEGSMICITMNEYKHLNEKASQYNKNIN